jgi:hypothetical protein
MMLKRISLLLALAIALPAFAAAEVWDNVSIIDTQCFATAKANPDAHTRTCAMTCSKSGFGMVDSNGNYLKFDDKGNQEAMRLLQNTDKKDHLRVDVTGNKDGNLIHVESLRLL